MVGKLHKENRRKVGQEDACIRDQDGQLVMLKKTQHVKYDAIIKQLLDEMKVTPGSFERVGHVKQRLTEIVSAQT